MPTSPFRFLLIDAGNTRVKWAVARAGGSIRVTGGMATKEMTGAQVRELAREFPDHATVLSSVVPKLVPFFQRAFGRRLHVVTGTSPALGLSFDYPKPGEIGADRLASAAAAHAQGRFPVVTVNCGTATAFTVLDAKGRLCGGVIAPGLRAQLSSLLGATAQLPATKLHAPRRALGSSTEDAIRAGVVLNFIGGVKEIVSRLTEALPGRPEVRIILTGGNAPYLLKALPFPAEHQPLLVFEGLRMMGARIFSSPP
jgi:type III pantothenate kinase